MKFFVFLICSLFSFAVFGEPYDIPRSNVVTLVEKPTSRVYPLYIQIPRSYHSQKEKRYPVIYITDAPYAFPIAAGATRFPMNSGAMEEAIIVGVSYSRGSRGASSRIRDFTTSKAASWEFETGNAEGHAKFFRDEVFPYIEKNYRVDAEKRVYIGNSLGGLFGAYILMKHPDMFNDYILGSPSVWFNNDDILSIKPRKPANHTRVFLAVGGLEKPEFGEREDMVSGAEKLADKLSSQSDDNLTVKFKIIDEARHSTAFPTTLIQGLDWIYGKS